LTMVIFKEQSSRHKELVQTITPLIQTYAKAMASPRAINDFVNRFAAVLEQWDYSPKELKGLDRRAFLDLVRSWQEEAPAKDIAMIKAVM